jgi:Flp pilus assembly protein TadD
MKKTFITILSAGLLSVTGLKAQSIQEGMNHLYADRFKSAIGVFEKLLAVNPNNIEATYWLGQTYFDMDENDVARKVYDKALATNGSAPLILVGLGHADLLDNKTSDARQKFEAALTASRGRKGDDPVVETAIGRANVDAKSGDFNYAILHLESATAKDPKNTETLLQLGNAYRKAKPGEGGGDAYKTYKKALEVNPAFAVVDLRLAKLFESQKNWELVVEYLNDALKRDANFSPAYYELFYYYFYRSKFPEAEEQLKKYIATTDADSQSEFLYAQLCWAKKDYDCAVTKAEGVVTVMGDRTKPKVSKLLADSYFQKGDFANAKKYIDRYFAKEKKEQIISSDYKLKADILSKTGGTDDEVYDTYVKGVVVDTVMSSKIDYLKQGAKFFKDAGKRDREAGLLELITQIKPNPTINDYFEVMLANYFDTNYVKSREVALTMEEKFPLEVFGYEWAYNNSIAYINDTTVTDTLRKAYQVSTGAPDALKLYEFSQKDTVKYKKNYINAVRFLAAYYINEAKDKQKSLEFFRKWLEADVANAATIQKYIDQIEKMPDPKGTPKSGSSSNTNSNPGKDKSKINTASKDTVQKT